MFPAASYQYVLYGMGFRTAADPLETADSAVVAARLLRENMAMTRSMRAQLPSNRDLIRKIHLHGMQAI